MKVKCINIYNEITKRFEDSSYWLTIGKEYIVLELRMHPGKNILYRLVCDNENKMPALYDAKQFDLVSNKISSTWVVNQLPSGTILFAPKSWQSLGFWEECYDGVPSTLEIYKREAKLIVDEENI